MFEAEKKNSSRQPEDMPPLEWRRCYHATSRHGGTSEPDQRTHHAVTNSVESIRPNGIAVRLSFFPSPSRRRFPPRPRLALHRHHTRPHRSNTTNTTEEGAVSRVVRQKATLFLCLLPMEPQKRVLRQAPRPRRCRPPKAGDAQYNAQYRDCTRRERGKMSSAA